MYGIDTYKMMDNNLVPRSGIKNLYFSGEDAYVYGVTPASGMLTSLVVLADQAMSKLPRSLATFIGYLPICMLKLLLPRNKKYSMSDETREILTNVNHPPLDPPYL